MPVPNSLTAPAMAPSQTARRIAEGDDDRLVIRPNYIWFFVHYADHPSNWAPFTINQTDTNDVPDEEIGTWLLPVLQVEPVVPGINGHKTLKRGQKASMAYDAAHLRILRDGGQVLPHSLGYIVPIDCVHPITGVEGVYYADAWSSPKPTRRGRRQGFYFDQQRYARWRWHLLADGVIAPPDETILPDLRALRERRVSRRQTDAALPPEKRDELIGKAQAALAVIEGVKVPNQPQAPAKRGRAPKAKE